MSDKYAALKQAAEWAIADEGSVWWNQEQLTHSDGPDMHRADAGFIANADPSTILELLAERDADRARIAEVESQRRLAFMACNRWADKFRESEQRIAELEARTLNRQRVINALTSAGIKLQIEGE